MTYKDEFRFVSNIVTIQHARPWMLRVPHCGEARCAVRFEQSSNIFF